jgi:hypothetical protein
MLMQEDDYLLTVNPVHSLQALGGFPGDEKAHMPSSLPNCLTSDKKSYSKQLEDQLEGPGPVPNLMYCQ